ncbi:hypothetical protein FPZ12_019340 [Amycolatopsis acidicola]|uniref:Uncharacterized protein n=1 Tax=Amycolatopsis acidicola TaxID=2596893 RepID=A0A5N0V3W8_9PSEU|nr:hypothetical protein [Amycolatopsis acidicola]KAA9159785.1 hypothetical protein FPZ12_019340 [Amycolatopsis acidicola]
MATAIRRPDALGTADFICGILATLTLAATIVTSLTTDARAAATGAGAGALLVITVIGFPCAYHARGHTKSTPALWGIILNEGVWIVAAAWFLIEMCVKATSI